VTVCVLGVGLWMPGTPDTVAWRSGAVMAGADTPPARLPARLQRRASLLISMAAEVATQAAAQAGLVLPDAQLPLVVGSAYGELATTMAILREVESEDGVVSPTRFQSSVHNSAAGYLSIAFGNQAPATSIAAGNDTVAMVLVEAMTLLACQGGLVLAIAADEGLPAALTSGKATPLAAALLLAAPDATMPRAPLAVLDDLRPEPGIAGSGVETDAPCSTILPLLNAILTAAERPETPPQSITLAPALHTPVWSLSVRSSLGSWDAT
jgi:hypothetical protein